MLLFVVLGCGAGSPAEVAERREDRAEQALARAMEAHWDHAEDLRDAAARARLEEMQTSARALQGLDPRVPEELAGMHAQFETAAGQVVAATDPVQASILVAELTARCGACHAAAQATPQLSPRLPPHEGSDDEAMLWHQLANVFLWTGLVTGDPDTWQRGAQDLARGRFAVDDGTADGARGAEFEARLHALATQADGAASGEWPAIYRRVLGTCAECHAQLGPR